MNTQADINTVNEACEYLLGLTALTRRLGWSVTLHAFGAFLAGLFENRAETGLWGPFQV